MALSEPAVEPVQRAFDAAYAAREAMTRAIDFFKANQGTPDDYADLIEELTQARAMTYRIPAQSFPTDVAMMAKEEVQDLLDDAATGMDRVAKAQTTKAHRAAGEGVSYKCGYYLGMASGTSAQADVVRGLLNDGTEG